MRVAGTPLTRWPRVATLATLALVWIPVPAQATVALPPGCTSGSATITCDGDLKASDVVEGTAGADTIVIKGNVPKGAIVRGGGGADKITVYDVGAFICPGKPGQIGAVAGKGGEVDGGAGDDTITVGGGTRSTTCQQALPAGIPLGNVSEQGKVTGGAGNDRITVGTLGYVDSDPDHIEQSLEVIAGRVDGGDGDDVVDAGWVATGAKFNEPDPDGVYGGPGKDTMHAGNVNGLGRASGGPGNDTLTVDGMNTGAVDGDDGDDTITATKGPLMTLAKIRGGLGNDKITAKSLWLTASLLGGDGDDTITAGTLNGPEEAYAPGFNAAYVDGEKGNDTISVELLGMSASAIGGDGADIITVQSVNGPEDTLRAGDGDDGKYHQATVNGWSGNDTISVGIVAKRGRVWGDGYPGSPTKGADTIKVSTVTGQSEVRGGALADAITVTNVNGTKATVYGDDGNDKITVTGKNAGTVNGGPGKDTCKTKGKKVNCES